MKLYRTEPHLLPEREPVDPTRGPTPYLLLLGSSISDSSDDDSQKLWYYSCFKPCMSSNCRVFAPCITRAKTASKTLVITNFAFSFVLSLARFASPSLQQVTATNFFKQCLFVGATKKNSFFFLPILRSRISWMCSISTFLVLALPTKGKDIVFMGCIHTWC